MCVQTKMAAARTSIGRPKSVEVTPKRVTPAQQPARKSRRLLGEEAQFELLTAQDAMGTEERTEREQHNWSVKDDKRRLFFADMYANALMSRASPCSTA